MRVLQIPSEVTQEALLYLHPIDIASFSQTCHSAHAVVYSPLDQYLWRELFLAAFDDPRESVNYRHANASYDWKHELQRRIRAELIAFKIERRFNETDFALETFISVISNASPVRPSFEHQQSRSLTWLIRILSDSGILDALAVAPEGSDGQLYSRIRTYFVLSLDRTNNNYNTNAFIALRIRSQCQVYDTRRYHPGNDYGPFLRGGAVNWIHVEALVNVIRPRLVELHSCPSVGLETTRAYSVTGAANRDAKDWACIEGSWRRLVCFLDYRCVRMLNTASIEAYVNEIQRHLWYVTPFVLLSSVLLTTFFL
jgi:hypothetical protein